MTRVTRLIHNAGKYLLISIYPLPTHPTHNFTHKNGGNLDTLPGWPKKLDHNRPAWCAGQWYLASFLPWKMSTYSNHRVARCFEIYSKRHALLRLEYIETVWLVFEKEELRSDNRMKTIVNGPLTRYVKMRVAHASGMPGTFSPPPTSKETTS